MVGELAPSWLSSSVMNTLENWRVWKVRSFFPGGLLEALITSGSSSLRVCDQNTPAAAGWHELGVNADPLFAGLAHEPDWDTKHGRIAAQSLPLAFSCGSVSGCRCVATCSMPI